MERPEMSLLSRLFGSKPDTAPAPEREPETHKGFAIRPEPIRESEGWRIAARIEKEVDGEVLSHHLIRADLVSDEDLAVSESARKARQMIDEQGDRVFVRSH